MKIFVVTILFIIISLAIYLSMNPSGIVVALNVVSRIRNNITHESIEIENCRWVYNRAGQGQILILLHGFGGSKESWNEIIPYLMKDYSIIAIDLPGFGESSKNTNFNYSIDSQVFRLHAFIEQLGLKNCHIAGNSMGELSPVLMRQNIHPGSRVCGCWIRRGLSRLKGVNSKNILRRLARTSWWLPVSKNLTVK